MKYAIGIDLGGTELRAAVVDTKGLVKKRMQVPTAAAAGPDVVIAQIETLICGMREGLAESDLLGVGVGSPGPLNPYEGVVIHAPTLNGWRNIPLRSLLAGRTGLRVELNNDANVAALGELRFGSGKGLQHFIYVTVSTGIGGGVIVDGHLLLGRHGLAGEVGHIAVSPEGPVCSCGIQGCWEAFASGTALGVFAHRRLGEFLAEGGKSRLSEIARSSPLQAHHVAAAASEGDEFAIGLMHREGSWLGIGLASLIHTFSPERIALGGGVSNSFPLFESEMMRTISRRTMAGFHETTIVKAELGRDAGIIGAACLVMN